MYYAAYPAFIIFLTGFLLLPPIREMTALSVLQVLLLNGLHGVLAVGWGAWLLARVRKQWAKTAAVEQDESLRRNHGRITDDLHDGLGAELSGLALRSQTAVLAVDSDPAYAKELLEEIGLLARRCMERVRMTMRSLGRNEPMEPDMLQELLDAISKEAAPGRAAANVRTETRTPIDPALAHDICAIYLAFLNYASQTGGVAAMHAEILLRDQDWSAELGGEGLPEPDERRREVHLISKRLRRWGGDLRFDQLPQGKCLIIHGRRRELPVSVP
jgi:glucose-6-phosphate-specific signal transduction histidine kinase